MTDDPQPSKPAAASGATLQTILYLASIAVAVGVIVGTQGGQTVTVFGIEAPAVVLLLLMWASGVFSGRVFARRQPGQQPGPEAAPKG